MRIALLTSLVVATLAPLSPALAGGSDAPVPGAPKTPPLPTVAPAVAWYPSVADAVFAAKAQGKPIFVAINASRVDGGKPEPAGKMLRDHTYRDAAIVEKSKAFACAIVYADAAGADFDELRSRFGLGQPIVSPQHIFGYSDGTLCDKREYWTPRTEQASIDALLEMMNRALAAQAAHTGAAPLTAPPPAPAPTAPAPTPAPADPGMAADPAADAAAAAAQARLAWIAKSIERIRAIPDALAREAAIREFLAADVKGDVVDALCTLVNETKKENELRTSIARVLGRPGMDAAVPTLIGLLDEKVDLLRSNAIVSLEYIGSPAAVESLTKRLSREKDERIYANACRALGRCGHKQESVRKTLVHELAGAKSDVTFAGAAIGLAHFEKDADAARALEAQIKKLGAGAKRGFALWALTEIHDPKSADFVKKEVLANEKNPWVLPFVSAVYNLLSDNASDGSQSSVDGGMSFIVGMIPGGIADPARRGREDAGYKPKCEFEGRGRGGPGGPGGPPGGPPAPPGMGG